MKITSRLALAFLLLLAHVAPLHAGTVHLGILKEADSHKFDCEGFISIEDPNASSRCASAKFGECSSCDSIGVTNNSDTPIDAEFEISGTGFSEPHPAGAFFFFGGVDKCDGPNGPRARPRPESCEHLMPGKSCSQGVEFCPEQSGTNHGQVKVTIRGAGEPKTTTFGLVGEAAYTPELQAADEARRRHVDELMKIPHVKKVELDPTDDEIFINVEVEEGKSLDPVRRAAPPKIEGYDVEVTTYMETGYAL